MAVSCLLAVSGACATRFPVQLDTGDKVEYSFGGGRPGAPHAAIALSGDGTITYTCWPGHEESGSPQARILRRSLPRHEMETIFQSLVDARLFNLYDVPTSVCDAGGCSVKAAIDGHVIRATAAYDRLNRHPRWRELSARVRDLLPFHCRMTAAKVDGAPPGTVRLSTSVSADIDTPATVLEVTLPATYSLVEGVTRCTGPLAAGERHTWDIVVRARHPGAEFVSARVSASEWGPLLGSGDSAFLLIDSQYEPTLLAERPQNGWRNRVGHGWNVNNDAIQSRFIFSNSPSLGSIFTVMYEVTSSTDFPATAGNQLSLCYPADGFKLIDAAFPPGGDSYEFESSLSWKGAIPKDRPLQVSARFKSLFSGGGEFFGQMRSGSICDVRASHVYVDQRGAAVTPLVIRYEAR